MIKPFFQRTVRGVRRAMFPAVTKSRAEEMADLFARSQQPTGQRVLFWVPGGMPLMLHVEGAIAAALHLRGVDVTAIICDGPFRACVLREATQKSPIDQWQDTCSACREQTSRVLTDMGIPFHFIGDFVSEQIQSEARDRTATANWSNLDTLHFDGIPVGENVQSAVLRYLQGFQLSGNDDVVREYAYSAMVTAAAASKAIDELAPGQVFMSHGIYAEWGPALRVAVARDIPVTAWMASYLPGRFYLRRVAESKNIDFHRLSDEAWEVRRRERLTSGQESKLERFLDTRYKTRGSFDMKSLSEYRGDTSKVREKYQIAEGRPTWGVLSHINWDGVSDYSPMAYASFDEWIVDTIETVIQLPNVQWLIKVHPAETTDNPASGVQKLVESRFPHLPEHVKVIPAEEALSPLDFFQLVDGGITVYGTAGLELALHGKPMILAGEAHYGNKGFTYDGLTREEYRQHLRNAQEYGKLSEEQQDLARRYAYSYFNQRQIPLPVVNDPASGWWKFDHSRRNSLLPKEDPFVDFICDCIMEGKEFVMDDALVDLAESL